MPLSYTTSYSKEKKPQKYDFDKENQRPNNTDPKKAKTVPKKKKAAARIQKIQAAVRGKQMQAKFKSNKEAGTKIQAAVRDTQGGESLYMQIDKKITDLRNINVSDSKDNFEVFKRELNQLLLEHSDNALYLSKMLPSLYEDFVDTQLLRDKNALIDSSLESLEQQSLGLLTIDDMRFLYTFINSMDAQPKLLSQIEENFKKIEQILDSFIDDNHLAPEQLDIDKSYKKILSADVMVDNDTTKNQSAIQEYAVSVFLNSLQNLNSAAIFYSNEVQKFHDAIAERRLSAEKDLGKKALDVLNMKDLEQIQSSLIIQKFAEVMAPLLVVNMQSTDDFDRLFKELDPKITKKFCDVLMCKEDLNTNVKKHIAEVLSTHPEDTFKLEELIQLYSKNLKPCITYETTNKMSVILYNQLSNKDFLFSLKQNNPKILTQILADLLFTKLHSTQFMAFYKTLPVMYYNYIVNELIGYANEKIENDCSMRLASRYEGIKNLSIIGGNAVLENMQSINDFNRLFEDLAPETIEKFCDVLVHEKGLNQGVKKHMTEVLDNSKDSSIKKFYENIALASPTQCRLYTPYCLPIRELYSSQNEHAITCKLISPVQVQQLMELFASYQLTKKLREARVNSVVIEEIDDRPQEIDNSTRSSTGAVKLFVIMGLAAILLLYLIGATSFFPMLTI